MSRRSLAPTPALATAIALVSLLASAPLALASDPAPAAPEAADEAEPAVAPVAGADRLAGMWQADMQQLLAGEEMTEEERAMTEALLSSARLYLSIAPDGTLEMFGSMMGQVQRSPGVWSASEDASGGWTMTMSVAGDAEVETLAISFDGPDRVTLDDGSGDVLALVRVDPASVDMSEFELGESSTGPASAPWPEPEAGFSASAEQLHGTWSADFVRMLSAQEMAPEEREFALALLAGSTLEVSFGADGALGLSGTMMGQQQSASGTWTAVTAEGNVLRLATTTSEGSGEPVEEVMTIVFYNADFLTLSDEAAEPIPFVRKR